MSDDGVMVEEIALLVGRRQTATTELVYRYDLRPVIRTGAVVMDRLFGNAATVNSADNGARRNRRTVA